MPSKRSHGEGTLRHRSDGRWELRMMDGYQKDGSPRFKTFYGKTQKEVKLKLKEYQDALISMFRNPFGRVRSSCSARHFRPENWTERH